MLLGGLCRYATVLRMVLHKLTYCGLEHLFSYYVIIGSRVYYVRSLHAFASREMQKLLHNVAISTLLGKGVHDTYYD